MATGISREDAIAALADLGIEASEVTKELRAKKAAKKLDPKVINPLEKKWNESVSLIQKGTDQIEQIKADLEKHQIKLSDLGWKNPNSKAGAPPINSRLTHNALRVIRDAGEHGASLGSVLVEMKELPNWDNIKEANGGSISESQISTALKSLEKKSHVKQERDLWYVGNIDKYHFRKSL